MRIGAVPEGIVERLIVLAGLAPTPIVDTFHAVIVARAIVVATKLGVFDAVTSRPQSASEMAEMLAVEPVALAKLNNLLVAIGYLKFDDDGYSATRLATKWLRSDSPHSLHDSMLLRLLEWQAIEATEAFVRTGRALDVHDLISGEQWGVYQRGMRSLARLSAGEVAMRVRLASGAATMLDIGGGHGAYAVAFCRRHRQLQATILDLPEAVDAAAPLLAEEGMEGRIAHRIGNALTDELQERGWDLIFASHVVHHFDSAANEGLTIRAARALRPGGVLAILDVLRPQSPTASSQTGALLDLYFAITSNSGTWSREEIVGWAQRAGLDSGRTIRLKTAPGVTVLTFTKPGKRPHGAAR